MLRQIAELLKTVGAMGILAVLIIHVFMHVLVLPMDYTSWGIIIGFGVGMIGAALEGNGSNVPESPTTNPN